MGINFRHGGFGGFLLLALAFLPVVAAAESAPTNPKLLQSGSISLEARIGTIIWSGLSWPVDADGNPLSTNGINGKNFLYPTIPVLGIGARFHIGPLIRIAPSLDFLFDEYVYRADLDRAFRTQTMTGKAVGPVATVMGLLVSIPVWFDFPLAERAVLSLAPGIAFFPRIAVAAIDGSENIDTISIDLNKEARWLYPETGIAFNYAFGEWFSAGLQIQIMYPLYHAWGSDGLPFHDAMMIIGTIGFDFYF